MYDASKPLETATVQDLWTALMLKREFNNFDPQPIVEDLYAQRHLWQKFWLGWASFSVNFYRRGSEQPISRQLEMLVYAEDDRLSKNDVLYIQASADDSVGPLLELGKRWQADESEVYGRDRLASILGRLAEGEEGRQLEQWRDRECCSPVIAMWWD